MNILITSAGRRAVLVQLFQKEARALWPKARVLASDLNPALAPACHVADGAFSVPAVRDPDYLGRLLKLCEAQQVRLLVPTIDTELQLLADHKRELEEAGVAVVISSANLVSECRDKRKTLGLFARHGVASPRQFDAPTPDDLPLIAKPFDGSCSQGLQVIRSADELRLVSHNDRRTIVSEYLSHDEHSEYTVDMYYDRHGQLKCFVPRLRMETRGGEVSKGRTCRVAQLDGLWERFGRLPGAVGCLTAQFFVHNKTGDVYGIEINPRFGGGYPLSYEAGANFPRWLLEEHLLGREIEQFDHWQDNLTMLRYDTHVLVPGAAA